MFVSLFTHEIHPAFELTFENIAVEVVLPCLQPWLELRDFVRNHTSHFENSQFGFEKDLRVDGLYVVKTVEVFLL